VTESTKPKTCSECKMFKNPPSDKSCIGECKIKGNINKFSRACKKGKKQLK